VRRIFDMDTASMLTVEIAVIYFLEENKVPLQEYIHACTSTSMNLIVGGIEHTADETEREEYCHKHLFTMGLNITSSLCSAVDHPK
jgi:hypothetical protein